MSDYLNIDTEGLIKISSEDLMQEGKRIAVFGKAGSGKSNAVTVICEELLARNNPTVIIDIMGEYHGLRAKYPILIIGNSAKAQCDRIIPYDAGAALASWVFSRNVSIILDVSGYASADERNQLLTDFASQFWKNILASQSRCYTIVLDEAHLVIPQSSKNTALKNAFTEMALMGRKCHLSMIIAAQRPASVEKGVITQANHFFLCKVGWVNDIALYREILDLPAKELKASLARMKPGHLYVVQETADEQPYVKTRVRQRATPDSSRTAVQLPAFGGDSNQQGGVSASLLDDLNALSFGSIPTTAQPDCKEATASLNATITKLQAEVTQLKADLEQARQKVVAIITPEAAQTQSEFDQALQIAQQKKFRVLIKSLKESKPADRAVVAFLMQNEADEWQLADIAPRIGMASESLTKNPPLSWLGRLFSRRQPNGGKTYFYKSCHQIYLTKEYPNLDVDALKGEILKVATQALRRP